MGSHMSTNILLASLSHPSHPQLSNNATTPDWLHTKSSSGKPKRILVCDPFKDNVDSTLKRMREILGEGNGVEVGAVDSESWRRRGSCLSG